MTGRARRAAADDGSPDPAKGGPRLIFVCTGNTCRSPLAAVIARREARRRGLDDVTVRSAGIAAASGSPAAGLGVIVAAARGLDLGGHRTRPLDFESLARADLALGMTPSHVAEMKRLHPAAHVALITDFLPADHPLHGRSVVDPIGGGRDEYEATFRTLEAAISGLFDRLEAESAGEGSEE